ncbi:MAG: hypothetical protein DI587_31305 [Variovorax paradoxus]|nr:MAG: hypothetical protein DI583_31305 [Variovorax paradoxus]PZQ03149.1 MAG: hypothetical protein DI587_31305 [Variovorax paradoxus]
MADQTSTRGKGGSKLTKTEITTVRLDPKLRYLAELAARKQRRTLSSFIEWSVEDALRQFALRHTVEGEPITLLDEAWRLWDVDAPDRFVKLAIADPDLLTHDEQVLWKLVKECGYLWLGTYSGPGRRWTWIPSEDNFLFQRLRDNWQLFQDVAAGQRPRSDLPFWYQTEADEVADADLNHIDANQRR